VQKAVQAKSDQYRRDKQHHHNNYPASTSAKSELALLVVRRCHGVQPEVVVTVVVVNLSKDTPTVEALTYGTGGP
jgi:hypothetical protein